jgi:outer membrane protein
MRTPILGAVLLAWGMGTAQGADLLEAWLAARQQHPDMVAATASQAASEARRLQASRLWNPTVAAQATTGVMGSRTSSHGAAFSMPGAAPTAGVDFETSVHGGPGARWGIEARWPLYSPERSAQERQLRLSAEVGDLQAASIQQQLMLQTAQRYFAAVWSQQQYDLLLRQQVASERALAEAHDRFALGDTPATDVREAEARALAVSAQVQAANIEMQIARQALAQTTGWSPVQLPPLHLPAQGDSVATATSQSATFTPLPEWLAAAAKDNLQLRMQVQALALAEQEAAKADRAASTKVDVVGQAGGDHLSGRGRWGSASNAARQFVVGVQIQVPLFTGGQQDARQQELLRLRDKAQAELDSTRLAIAQQVHATWLQLQASASRTVALESAHRAARLRLEATQLGREVGDRTTLELLQAQNDATLAASHLLQHRVRTVQDRLQLPALAGRLDETALQSATEADRTLSPPEHP